ETPGRSVCPTVSESMLNARRRNSEAMRFRTPGRSSTYTTNECFFSVGSLTVSLIRGRFHQRAGAPDQGMQIGTGWNHGVHGIFLLDAKVDQSCAGMIPRGFQSGQHLAALADRKRGNAVGIRELHEIGT